MALITSVSTAHPSSSTTLETIPKYEYKHLRDQQIRVFKLGAGSHYKHITGSLYHDNLDSFRDFEALSYEWGNPEKKHEVLVKNDAGQVRSIGVTQSLYTALQDLRHWYVWSGDRFIWADALCINQADIEERQKQVAMMGDVYRNASRSITYIGPAYENTASVIETMTKLLDAHISYAPIEKLNSIVGNSADAIKDLVSRGWAGRSWCVQEFILNQNLVIMCGRVVLSFEIFWEVLAILLYWKHSIPDDLVMAADDATNLRAESAWLLCVVRRRSQACDHLWLNELLVVTWSMRASDPRDKVYSLLGLANDAKDLNIKVDYTCDVANLFIEVTSRIFQQHQNFHLLSFSSDVKSLDLPSWVRDWSQAPIEMDKGAALFHEAATSRTACVRVLDHRVLEARGCVIDRVGYVSEPMSNFLLFIEDLDKRTRGLSSLDDWKRGEERSISLWLDGLIAHVAQLVPYPSGHSEIEVVWRTLIYNLNDNYDPAGKESGATFESLREFIKYPTHITREMLAEALHFLKLMRWNSGDSRLFTTKKKWFGSGLGEVQEGDVVCLLEGARCLFILREVADNKYKFICPAYVHELMDGEALEMENYKATNILIV